MSDRWIADRKRNMELRKKLLNAIRGAGIDLTNMHSEYGTMSVCVSDGVAIMFSVNGNPSNADELIANTIAALKKML